LGVFDDVCVDSGRCIALRVSVGVCYVACIVHVEGDAPRDFAFRPSARVSGGGARLGTESVGDPVKRFRVAKC